VPLKTKNNLRAAFEIQLKVVMKQRAPLFAGWLATPVIATCLAIVLIISMGEGALAFDCLAYKPERAQGQWHADVVAGKICWSGPNWRSFLPKPKARADSSRVTNNRPVTQVENSKPHTQVEKSKPDIQIENSQPEVSVENPKPEISVVSKSLPSEALDAEKAQVSPGLREATRAEAAAFTNAVSPQVAVAPTRSSASSKTPTESESIADLLLAFSLVALGTIGLVTLIMMRGRNEVISETDVEAQPLETYAGTSTASGHPRI
jgi:hypothetical protein